MSKKKLTVAIIAAAVLVVAAVALWLGTQPEVFSGWKSFTVTVVHADGSEKTFSYTTSATHVGPFLQKKGLVEGYMGPYGLYMEAVDGERAIYEENGAYWSFYIGEEYAQTGIDKTPIQDGVHYRLVYEKFAPTTG